MNPSATASLALPVFVQGLALSFGLIVAIGAQNAFVLRQGLRREHVGSALPQAEIDAAWAAEIERRLAQVDSGEVETIPYETVIAELRAKYG